MALMEHNLDNQATKYNWLENTFDLDGNMTFGSLEGQWVTYTYDSRNHLLAAGDTVYSYDAQDRRIGDRRAVVTPH